MRRNTCCSDDNLSSSERWLYRATSWEFVEFEGTRALRSLQHDVDVDAVDLPVALRCTAEKVREDGVYLLGWYCVPMCLISVIKHRELASNGAGKNARIVRNWKY